MIIEDISSVLLLSTIIHLSFGLRGNTCEINGMIKCCYNHEEVNGICLQCKVGTVAIDGSSCRPCANNTYGTKCIGRCNCKHQERCDPVRGCIFWIGSTTFTVYEEEQTTTDIHIADRGQTTTVSISNYNSSIRLVTEISITKNSENADNLSKREWIVYSLCIGTVILLFGLSHLVRKYRKLKCSTQTSFTADVEIQHENKIERESQSIYDEIDDILITENAVKVISPKTDSLETPGQKGHETDHSESESGDKDGYLLPCISAYDSIKDDTDVYLIPCISEQDSIKDNTDVYLIPCISGQESIKDNTHGYLEILPCISAKDSIKGDRDASLISCMFEQDSIKDNNDVHLELLPCFSAQDSIKDDACSHSVSSNGSSSDFSFKLDPICNADYLNPYQALKYDNRPTSMHNYETSVIVHAVDCPLPFNDKTNTQSECHEREEDMSTDVKSEEAEEEYHDDAIAQ